jgi:hypothetical protein
LEDFYIKASIKILEMKLTECHFEDYLNNIKKHNLHPKFLKQLDMFPEKIDHLKNVILYGPAGIGKYSQALNIIKKYSPSELKYEKKIGVQFNKTQYIMKISDIHYEVDMSLLGCNAKLLWHEIFQQIVDIVSAKTFHKCGIILCKHFSEIHNELLDAFYSYMQNNMHSIDLKFILITDEISFIPTNILNCCETIPFQRPCKTSYAHITKRKWNPKLNLNAITNIKYLQLDDVKINEEYKIICNKIIHSITNLKELNYLKFRELIYDIFIYNLNMAQCLFYILSSLVEKGHLDRDAVSNVLVETYAFLKYYNNNYRPIYHVEQYFLNLSKIINGI